ncbi:unnamed protein product [Rotaria magnacalcarata]|uniref:Uncharacterized protein n=1 Tax=Rotaria magnacalcarata TaxID=392030 RepID=A0A814HU44_9BILA|nr:unnamed protein product [Rotaria magnacalcarata]CAF1585047.1 unnamed protein product [Rotaria magnacalcarata]CAF1920760.1 unnamed protein product [Rotaria magnacalcarata]CAF2016165.1 unnamed protein product [Rotaria magnacalcarata]CAF2130875.1 unnamed protein product [Rotaria magnacalcarata]
MMLPIRFVLFTAFVLQNIQTVQSIICYQCTDCPLPFSKNYPYVTLSTNTNFEAKCLTTVVKLSDGSRFISKGSAFNCPPATAATDVQLNCCEYIYEYTQYQGHSLNEICPLSFDKYSRIF